MATWTIDNTYSSLQFSLKRFGVDWIKGGFRNFSGTVTFDPDRPEEASVEAIIEAKSIFSGDEKLDAHLQSGDFFDVENHPEVTFKSTEIKKDDENTFSVTGELTIRDITKPVTLSVQYHGEREIPGPDNEGTVTRTGFTAKTIINRQSFGMSWDTPGGNGAATTGGDVEITINAEALKDS